MPFSSPPASRPLLGNYFDQELSLREDRVLDATGVSLGHFEPEAGWSTLFETGGPLPLVAAIANAVRETAVAPPNVREGELPEA